MARAPRGEGRLKTWLVRLGQLALTAAVTWLIVDRVGLDLAALGAVDVAAWRPDAALLAGASLALLSGYFLSGALWGRIVVDLGGPRLPPAEAVRLFMIANLGRYVPGKVWQIAGLAALAKGRGVPAATAMGAAVLGQGIALAAATLIGLGALLSAPQPTRAWGWAALAAVAVGVALTAVPSVFDAVAGLWFRLARTEAPSGLGRVHALRWLGLYALNWAVYALSFWMLARSLGLGGALVPVSSAFAAAYVLGYVAFFAPAGAGVREASLTAFLAPHVGVAPAGALALLARVWTTAVEVVPAGVFWAVHVRSRPPNGGASDAGAHDAPVGPEPGAANE